MEFEVFIKNHVGIALTRGSLFRFGIIWQERNVVLIVSQKQHLGWHEAAKVTFQRSLCCKWFSNDTNSNRLNCKPGSSRDLWVVKDFDFKSFHFRKLTKESQFADTCDAKELKIKLLNIS